MKKEASFILALKVLTLNLVNINNEVRQTLLASKDGIIFEEIIEEII